MFDPEVVLRERTVNVPNEVILELIAGTQARNRDVLLPQIRVDGSFARQRRREVLNIGRAGADDTAVRAPALPGG